jgi:DNA-binding IclR family transcriptional regulator
LRDADRVLGTLAVHYAATAVPSRSAIDQFLPKMREVAGKIEAEFTQKSRESSLGLRAR